MQAEAFKETQSGIYSRGTLIAFFVLTCAVTTGLVAWYAPADMSWFRIIVGGLALSGLSYLSVFVNHMLLNPLDPDEEVDIPSSSAEALP